MDGWHKVFVCMTLVLLLLQLVSLIKSDCLKCMKAFDMRGRFSLILVFVIFLMLFCLNAAASPNIQANRRESKCGDILCQHTPSNSWYKSTHCEGMQISVLVLYFLTSIQLIMHILVDRVGLHTNRNLEYINS